MENQEENIRYATNIIGFMYREGIKLPTKVDIAKQVIAYYKEHAKDVSFENEMNALLKNGGNLNALVNNQPENSDTYDRLGSTLHRHFTNNNVQKLKKTHLDIIAKIYGYTDDRLSEQKEDKWHYYLGYYQKSFANLNDRNGNVSVLLLRINATKNVANIEYLTNDKDGTEDQKDICYDHGKVSIGNKTTVIVLNRTNESQKQTTLLLPKLNFGHAVGSGFVGSWNRIYMNSSLDAILVGFKKIENDENWKELVQRNSDFEASRLPKQHFFRLLNYIQDKRVSIPLIDPWKDTQELGTKVRMLMAVDRRFFQGILGDYHYYYLVNNDEGNSIRRTPLKISLSKVLHAKHYNSEGEEVVGSVKIFDDRAAIEFGHVNKRNDGLNYSILEISKGTNGSLTGFISGVTEDKKQWCSRLLLKKEALQDAPKTEDVVDFNAPQESAISPEMKKELRDFFVGEDHNYSSPSLSLLEKVNNLIQGTNA